MALYFEPHKYNVISTDILICNYKNINGELDL